jgi:hypothetical protein
VQLEGAKVDFRHLVLEQILSRSHRLVDRIGLGVAALRQRVGSQDDDFAGLDPFLLRLDRIPDDVGNPRRNPRVESDIDLVRHLVEDRSKNRSSGDALAGVILQDQVRHVASHDLQRLKRRN